MRILKIFGYAIIVISALVLLILEVVGKRNLFVEVNIDDNILNHVTKGKNEL